MQTTTTAHGQLVTLSGRLDAGAAAQIRGLLHAAVLDGAGPLTVDMKDVQFLDAVGLGVLMGAYRLAASHERSLVLRNCPERIARLLRAIKLHRVLRFDETVAGPSAGKSTAVPV
ncbi:MAG TPA: STAS domain-containing protein [Mycobacteriales bacterium]|nr:STAS domain-containing protein [Mycobacteriales bacterium]